MHLQNMFNTITNQNPGQDEAKDQGTHSLQLVPVFTSIYDCFLMSSRLTIVISAVAAALAVVLVAVFCVIYKKRAGKCMNNRIGLCGY